MPPPRKTGPTDRRDSLIQAAAQVFSERGYQGSTMDEIARRAGVAKGTPYLYFSDKADLFYAVFERWASEAMAGSEEALEAPQDAPSRLLALALGAVAYMESHREMFPLTMEVWAASNTPALRERFASALGGLYQAYRAAVADIVREGQARLEIRAEVDAEAVASLLTGAIDGLFLQCWFDPKLPAERFVRGFIATLIEGLAPQQKGGLA